MTNIIIYDWRMHAPEYNPLLPYQRFIEAQRDIVQRRLARLLTNDVLILTHHPPTITLGARSLKEQLSHIRAFLRNGAILNAAMPDDERLKRAALYLRQSYGVDLVKTNRGGSVWYHDPGVLQLYLIAEVPPYGISDIRYPLEEVLLRILADLGVAATRVNESVWRQDKSFIGIWVGEKKIAAIGIRIERRYDRCVSMFGASLNIAPDRTACEMIDPCGIPNRQMTSVAQELGTKDGLPYVALMPIIQKHTASVFGTKVLAAT